MPYKDPEARRVYDRTYKKRKRREDPVTRNKHRLKAAARWRDPIVCERERLRRQDPVVRQKKYLRDMARLQKPEVRAKERLRDAARRQDPVERQKRQLRQQDPIYHRAQLQKSADYRLRLDLDPERKQRLRQQQADHYAHKKILKNPDLMDQAVLAQIDQLLGIPTSINGEKS